MTSTKPTYQTLQYDVSEGVATLTLHRPDAANAIDLTLGRELMDAVTRAESDARVRALLLTGSGKMFSGGGDLASFAKLGDDLGRTLRELTGYLHLSVSRLLRLKAPVVVAVNGVAAGGGMSLALSGDLVLAAESARFTMAYTRIGLVPDGGSSHVLPRLVGLRRAQELIFTNRVLSAQEALEWGLVTRVLPDAELMAEARKLARTLADGPTAAFGATKRLLLSTFSESAEAQMELESQSIARAGESADGREGIGAFLEKRAASFQGR
jgi:2-(1,2-epoxy-1,2-dihydrophenyl)acetyl-CoA isomerase